MKTLELELDEATVEERQYKEYGEFDVLKEKSENLEDFVATMIALDCTYNGCTSGEGGAKFRTPALEKAQYAQEYLNFHIEDVHGRQVVGVGGGADKAWFAKIPSTKFHTSDGHTFYVDEDIIEGHITFKFEEEEDVMKDVNYSTLISKSSEEKPFKPVTSDVTRRAKKAAKKARWR